MFNTNDRVATYKRQPTHAHAHNQYAWQYGTVLRRTYRGLYIRWDDGTESQEITANVHPEAEVLAIA